MVDIRENLVPGALQARPRERHEIPARVATSLAKRVADLIGAGLLLIFLSPVLLAAAALIAAEGGGPILFRQSRTGLGGRVIRVLKFRTLSVVEEGDAVVAVARADPRITRVGALLRRTSVDELPQLLNVLRGEMSLVGPRPHALVHDRLFSALLPDYGRRFQARPGLTGLAQVTGFRGAVDSPGQIAARLQADTAYIDAWSMELDARILLRTARILLLAPDGA